MKQTNRKILMLRLDAAVRGLVISGEKKCLVPFIDASDSKLEPASEAMLQSEDGFQAVDAKSCVGNSLYNTE